MEERWLFEDEEEEPPLRLPVMQKEIAATSREALAKQLSRIPARWIKLLRVIEAARLAGEDYTGRELIEFLGVTDMNLVRPELTRMKQKGLLSGAQTRLCRVSGFKVQVYEITGAGRDHLARYREIER